MISPQEADQLIEQHLPAFPVQSVPLAEAHGQILRETVTADRDLPPYNRVTMDGIAIAYAAWQAGQRRFRIEATAAAGQSILALTDTAAGCVQVMTGAMLPEQSDTVVPYEDLDVTDDIATIHEAARLAPLQNLHSRGSDRRTGDPVLREGICLRGPHIGIAAAVGRPTLSVAARPTVAVISTGDELREVDESVEPYQIRSANDRAIRASFLNAGYHQVDAFRIHDDLDQTIQLLDRLLNTYGVLILSGGVSMGKRDYVPAALTQLGVKNVFHKIRQKPGKPMWFGVHPKGIPVFALPGNTVSSLVCLHRYVLPGLDRALGATTPPATRVTLQQPVRFPLPLTAFIPVQLEIDEGGTTRAHPMETNTSGDFSSLSDSAGFVELPEGKDVFEVGEVVTYRAWS